MGICMRGGESERGPPCGCAAYMWICGIVCVVAIVCVTRDGQGGARETSQGRPTWPLSSP